MKKPKSLTNYFYFLFLPPLLTGLFWLLRCQNTRFSKAIESLSSPPLKSCQPPELLLVFHQVAHLPQLSVRDALSFCGRR